MQLYMGAFSGYVKDNIGILVLDKHCMVDYLQSVHPGRGLGHDGDLDGVDVAPAG